MRYARRATSKLQITLLPTSLSMLSFDPPAGLNVLRAVQICKLQITPLLTNLSVLSFELFVRGSYLPLFFRPASGSKMFLAFCPYKK